ncbi:MAG: hypothetical protein PHV25_02210 [Candidatus Pacebacteria bacterium]|nr:hypothetical protein [Candidatus Paceibacterota bacterium]
MIRRIKVRATRLRRVLWNKGVRLWWARLYIRKDEFHPSLTFDAEAAIVMDRKERDEYYEGLKRRQHIAHERGLK